MVFGKPGLGRRLAAGGIDLYNFCYVALLPIVLLGALALWREGTMLRDELGRARETPKGHWKVDAPREAALARKRAELASKLFGDANSHSMKFLNGLAPLLDADAAFKASLDAFLDHPYTALLNRTWEQGKAALRRHLQTSLGARSLETLQAALHTAAELRVADYVRDEVSYRLEQVAGYLGLEGLRQKALDALHGTATVSAATRVAGTVDDALQWTHLLDQILSGKARIAPATTENLGLLRLGALLALCCAALYLALRDLLGRGGSPGKRHAGLRVVDARTGAPATAGQRAVRGVLLLVLLPVELALALVDQRIGDRVAHTRVVTEEEPSA